MTTRIHRTPPRTGNYAVTLFEDERVAAMRALKLGIVHFGAGMRTPASGRRVSAHLEFAYVISGRLRFETDAGTVILEAGDTLVGIPSEPHSTLALEDSSVFFAGLDP